MADRPANMVNPPPPSESAGKVKRSRLAWWRVWSLPAAMRVLRAVLVIPSLFALTYEGFGNLQMALFAAFGGFASLVVASFGGSSRDKIVAHLGLAVTGSIALVIGTVVSGIEWLAVLVTIPVAFGIFRSAAPRRRTVLFCTPRAAARMAIVPSLPFPAQGSTLVAVSTATRPRMSASPVNAVASQ